MYVITTQCTFYEISWMKIVFSSTILYILKMKEKCDCKIRHKLRIDEYFETSYHISSWTAKTEENAG